MRVGCAVLAKRLDSAALEGGGGGGGGGSTGGIGGSVIIVGGGGGDGGSAANLRAAIRRRHLDHYIRSGQGGLTLRIVQEFTLKHEPAAVAVAVGDKLTQVS